MVVQYTKRNGKIIESKLICVEEKDLKDGYKLKIPDGITIIGRDAFKQIRNLGNNLKVKMSDTVTSIEREAFSHLSIQKMKFSKNLEKMGDEAFSGTTFIEDVILPDRLKCIPTSCFSSCKFNQFLKLPNHLIDIEESAFYGATFKKRLILPKRVKEIPRGCFDSTTFDQGIELPKNLKRINNYAFKQANLKELEMPDSVECMKEGAFFNSSIQRIKLSKNLTYISRRSFAYTDFLKEIEIPDKVVNIGDSAFCGSNLKKVILHEGLQGIGCSAFKESNLQEVEFPYTLQTIMYASFMDCSSLKRVSFPKFLEEIGQEAFCNCVIEEVHLPRNVNIGKNAFLYNHIRKISLSQDEFHQIKLKKNGAFNQNPLIEIKINNWKNLEGVQKQVSKRKVRKIKGY